MLSFTPYLGGLLLIVSIFGWFMPALGYMLPLVMVTLFISSIFSGRWFCGNLCPRGSFNDFWLTKISRKKKIPTVFRSMWIRIPLFIAMIAFMAYRLMGTKGLFDQIGIVFVSMCAITTAIAIIFGVKYSPRAWCTFCPMGTMQAKIGGDKKPLKVDLKKCIDCGICEKICPMQLKVKQILSNPDCIKCGRCISSCPTKALSF